MSMLKMEHSHPAGQPSFEAKGSKFWVVLSSRRRKICPGRSSPLSIPLHGKVDVLAFGVSLPCSQYPSCGVVCCFYSCLGKFPFIPKISSSFNYINEVVIEINHRCIQMSQIIHISTYYVKPRQLYCIIMLEEKKTWWK